MPTDIPGGPVLKNPPSNARDVSSIPGLGTKIPYATGQLSYRAVCSRTRESVGRSVMSDSLWPQGLLCL